MRNDIIKLPMENSWIGLNQISIIDWNSCQGKIFYKTNIFGVVSQDEQILKRYTYFHDERRLTGLDLRLKTLDLEGVSYVMFIIGDLVDSII